MFATASGIGPDSTLTTNASVLAAVHDATPSGIVPDLIGSHEIPRLIALLDIPMLKLDCLTALHTTFYLGLLSLIQVCAGSHRNEVCLVEVCALHKEAIAATILSILSMVLEWA